MWENFDSWSVKSMSIWTFENMTCLMSIEKIHIITCSNSNFPLKLIAHSRSNNLVNFNKNISVYWFPGSRFWFPVAKIEFRFRFQISFHKSGSGFQFRVQNFFLQIWFRFPVSGSNFFFTNQVSVSVFRFRFQVQKYFSQIEFRFLVAKIIL